MANIAINGVSVAFPIAGIDRLALSDVNTVIRDGEFVCLLGPSGCGKSTLLNVIGGLIEATTGNVKVGDQYVQKPGPDRGMVFQNYTLYQWLTVRQNVEFGPRLNGWHDGTCREVADRLINLVDLADFADEYPKALSGGMRQRVAIARALAMEPEVLLMDEPFGALDAQTRTRMQELLLEIWTKAQRTVVFVTHDIEEAIFLADRILIMGTRPGRIVEEIVVDLPRPRTFECVASSEFAEYRREIINLLRH
jgi:NitT/TauT family transport system ATP-binding protein